MSTTLRLEPKPADKAWLPDREVVLDDQGKPKTRRDPRNERVQQEFYRGWGKFATQESAEAVLEEHGDTEYGATRDFEPVPKPWRLYTDVELGDSLVDDCWTGWANVPIDQEAETIDDGLETPEATLDSRNATDGTSLAPEGSASVLQSSDNWSQRTCSVM